jgi:hypothetical protein
LELKYRLQPTTNGCDDLFWSEQEMGEEAMEPDQSAGADGSLVAGTPQQPRMPSVEAAEAQPLSRLSAEKLTFGAVVAGVFFLYLFSNPAPMNHFDYSFRIAEAMLHGRLGLIEHPPPWLNEMVPVGNRYYSAFPLGSVLCLLPFALLKVIRIFTAVPGGLIIALLAAGSAAFFFRLSSKQEQSLGRRVVLALFPLFATWAWTDLAFAGAWHLAFGFAMLGQAGALYFTLVKPRPVIAGLFFAVAFGNRTELIVTAPFFIYFLTQSEGRQGQLFPLPSGLKGKIQGALARLSEQRRVVAQFLVIPAALFILTLAYNYARFHALFDSGYTRIPGLMQNAAFQHGLYSIYSIPANAGKMLFSLPWRRIDHRPYLVPLGFGGSILLSSPMLFLLFRRGSRDPNLFRAAWIAIALIALVLWLQADPGGWQFAYGLAMVLIPWTFLVMLNNGGPKLSRWEVALFSVSVVINAFATYEFLWTNNVQP